MNICLIFFNFFPKPQCLFFIGWVDFTWPSPFSVIHSTLHILSSYGVCLQKKHIIYLYIFFQLLTLYLFNIFCICCIHCHCIVSYTIKLNVSNMCSTKLGYHSLFFLPIHFHLGKFLKICKNIQVFYSATF